MSEIPDEEEMHENGSEEDPSSSDDDDEESTEDIDDGQSSDDDDADENDQADMVDEEELKKLEAKLTDNPNDYQAYISYITGLRSAGDLDKLRETREKFRVMYPLTPKLWLEWIQDERQVDTPTERIIELFELALVDYLSVELWLEYVQFACGALPPDQTRELCERGLSQVGQHVSDGRILWDAYRVLESALMSGSADVEASSEKLLKLFKRQISLPLIGLEETYQEFLSLFEDKLDSSLKQAHESAAEELRTLMPLENDLATNEKSLDSYLRYLDFEENGPSAKPKEKSVNMVRLQCLFERAITDHCLDVELWLRYLRWLEKHFTSATSIKQIVLPICERSVRNCSWDARLWMKYALAIERSNSDDWFSRADAIFERALISGYTSVDEAAEIWLTRAYQKRRAITSSLCDNKNVAEVFDQGANFLKKNFGDQQWDVSTVYRRSWASFLAMNKDHLLDDALVKARDLWHDILSNDGNGRLANVWCDYIQLFERRFGDKNETRKSLYRALNSVTDFPEYVALLLRRFELEEGTLQELDESEERIRRQTARINERKQQQYTKAAATKRADWQETTQPQQQKKPYRESKQKGQRENASFANTATKRKRIDVDTSASPSKKPKTAVNVSATTAATAKPKSEIDHSNPPDPHRQKRTIFVSNLDFGLSEEKLKEVFEAANIGKILEVRLVKLRPDRSKGYGYIELESEEKVKLALGLDRQRVEGRPMYVSEYKVPGVTATNTAASKFNFSAGLEKCKLFVKNIPKHVGESDLKALFEPYGELKSVRLVTFRSGQSKGMAYVEFTNEETAKRALEKTEGTFLFGKQLSVDFSNPPARRTGFSLLDGPDHRPKTANAAKSSNSSDADLMPPPQSKLLVPRALNASQAPKSRLQL